MGIYNDFDEIKTALDSSGCILSLKMEELRDAHGVNRLGIHVLNAIHDNLQGKGIGHLPADLPQYQEEFVRLYSLGSPFANLLGDLKDYSKESDRRLIELSTNEYEEIIKRIRELVC